MLMQDDAVALVKQHVFRLDPDFVVYAEPIVSGDFGWVFGYQSNEFLRTGHLGDMLAGNAPLLVERQTGAIHTLGTASPVEFYVENYLRTGDPHTSNRD